MGFQVVNGAMMTCSFGSAPGSLVVLPANGVMAGGVPAANIMDHKPGANIAGFVMCSSMSNPAVASATSAALGVLTPMPCSPATAAPWTPGCSSVMIGGMPALNDASTCTCTLGGTITISYAGQAKVQIP